jgi:tetratricopeptide (TPR) repeat protein/O-antigen ligase
MVGRLLDIGVEAGIVAILLLTPVPYGSVFPWAQACLEALVAVTAGLWVARMVIAGRVAIRLNPLLWPGVAMLLLIAFQLAIPNGTVNRYATWESFRLFVAYLAFLIVLGAHLVTPGRIVRLTWILVAWGGILASWGLVNRALGRELVLWFEKEWYQGRLVSTFVNANHQALYFAVLLFIAVGMVLRPGRRSAGPVSAWKGSGMSLDGTGAVARVLCAGAVALFGVALVLTASRGGVAAAGMGLLAMGVLAVAGRVRGGAAVAVVVGVAAFTLYVTWLGAGELPARFAVLAREPFADLRWQIWHATLGIAGHAPILGVGLGALEDALAAHPPTGLPDGHFIDYAHNDYLQLLSEAGALGAFVLGWAIVAWSTFVVVRWRERQDVFVRGLVLGGIGAVAAAAFHSTVDFGLHMPGNAVLVVAVLALVPAAVTLRMHRTGPQVDLREWRRELGPRARLVLSVATAGLVLLTVAGLAPVAIADWHYQAAERLISERRYAWGAVTGTDLATAERRLRTAARFDPWNPRIQTAWALVAGDLGLRVWMLGLAPDGTPLKTGSAPERLAVSQPQLTAAFSAYERSLRSRPLISLTHDRFGRLLARMDDVRRTVEKEGLRDAVGPDLAPVLASPESLVPRAFHEFEEAVRLDSTSASRRLSLAAFALAHLEEIPEARKIVVRESKEAIRLDARALRVVAQLLTAPAVEADLLWHAVPRDAATLVDLSRVLETWGRHATAAAALEDAVAIAATPREKASVHLARAHFLLRRQSQALALGEARQALVFAPNDPEVFAALAEAYDANGMAKEAESALGSALAASEDHSLPRVAEYRRRLVALLERRDDKEGVLALRRQAVKAAPNDAVAHLELAGTLEWRQEREEAAREYETARMLGPTDAGLQRAVAQAFARLGLFREAIGVAEHGLRLDPSADDLRVELGDLYSKVGMPDRAKEQYQAVLGRQPAHEAAARGLANLRNPS